LLLLLLDDELLYSENKNSNQTQYKRLGIEGTPKGIFKKEKKRTSPEGIKN
jgi:hypothetical protein